MNLNRRHLFSAGLGAMAVASLAACQQQKPGEGGGRGSDPQGSTQTLPSTAWERADYSAVKDGGTLTLSVAQVPDNWNSDQTQGNLADLSDIREPQGYGQFSKASEAGEISFNPDYIVEATLTSTEPQVVTVKMNPKAVWEDGTPITIKDLQAYATALSGKDKAYQLVSTKGWEDIKEVKQTADEFTGEIHFANKVVDWQPLCYPSLPASISSDPEVFNNGYTAKGTPSCGPFKLKSFDKTAIILERNPNWWGQKPKLESIIFRVLTQQQQPSSFGNGEIDVVDIANGDVYNTAKKRSDVVIQKSNGVTWTHLTINTERITDLEVRKAIAYGVNREVIGAAVISPLETPVVLLNDVIYLPGQKGYIDPWNGEVKYDKAKAEEILQAAGYAKGSDGVYAKDGKPLAFSVTVPADAKSNIDRATQVQKDLNAIGFKIDLQTVPSDNYFKEYVQPHNFDLVTFSWVGTAYPHSGINLFSPKESKQNFTGWGDEKVDKLGVEAYQEFDKEKRIKVTNDFSKALLNAFPIIPFYVTPKVMGLKKGLVNFGARQFESVDWTTVGFKA
ncbi:MAG: ABC transporter family substrate-binding protein [Propionibacteriaceae bacterium]|nr:ABC transporter family substrate-binding protein [Propionibacteriaceae bacterium]